MEKIYLIIGVFLGSFGTWLLFLLFGKNKGMSKSDPNLSDTDDFSESSLKAESVLLKTKEDSSNAIIIIAKAYYLGISGFQAENIKLLDEIGVEIEEFNMRAKRLKSNTFMVMQKLQQDSIETGHYYVQIVDYLREMAHSIKYFVKPLSEHLTSNYKPFSEEQNEDLVEFGSQVSDFLNFALHIIKEYRFGLIEELIQRRQALLEMMREQEIQHIIRINRNEINSSTSILYFGMMSETKNLLLLTVNLLKATRDFVSYTKS